MKEILIEGHGDADVLSLRDAQPKALATNAVRIRNAYAGVNFIDIYQRQGLYPISLPAVLGQEGAGEIIEVGPAVMGFAVGDRVAFMSGAGGYASEACVPATNVAAIPDSVQTRIAAAVFLKALTVKMLTEDVYSLKAGDTSLVYAAAGGVGSLLCQWCTAIGAKVIGVVSSETKAAAALRNGADHVIDRTTTGDIAGQVRALTNGRGADVVYDSVGAATFEASLDSVAMRGMMISFGNASGPAPAIAPLDLTRRGSIILARPSLMHYATPDRIAAMASTIFDKLTKGVLKPEVSAEFPLEAAAEAHRLLQSGKSLGAIVLKL